MKLRIRGDSLRFRLSQREVSRLLAGDKVGEIVRFSSSGLHLLKYSLQSTDHGEQVAARFENGEILVEIPSRVVEDWGKSDQIGIESTQPTGEGRGLRILVEKDFQCLQPRSDEDESDNFPNPEKTAVRVANKMAAE